MRTIKLLLSFLFLFSAAQAQQILNEQFTGYTNGNLNGQGGWITYTVSGSTPEIQVQSATPLIYSGYSAGGGSYISVANRNAGTGRSHYKMLSQSVATNNTSGAPTQTFYYSFLVRVSDAVMLTSGDAENYSVALRNSSGTTGDFSTGRFSIHKNAAGNWVFGVAAGGSFSYYNTNTSTTSQTFLVLMRYDMIPGSNNDVAYMWVNPDLSSEPSTASATTSAAGNLDYGTKLDALMVLQRDNGNRPAAQFDGFKVGLGTTSASAFAYLTLADCTAPSAQPGGLTFTNVGSTSVSGSFSATPSAGNYLVVRTTGNAPSSPVNGTVYTAGSTALGGTIVSAGTATTFTASGLSSSTSYSFYIYSYNYASCSGGPVYYTVSPLTGTITTAPAPLLIDENFTGYNNGDLNGQGGWINFNSGSAPNIQVQNTTAMVYPGYASGNPYISVANYSAGAGRSAYKLFSQAVSGNTTAGAPTQTFYYSFLVRVSDATTIQDNGNYSVSLRLSSGVTENESVGRFIINKDNSGKWMFGLAAGTTQTFYTTNSSSTSDVFLIIIRYDMVPNANDLAYMWVNPSQTSEPATATANVTSTSGTNSYGNSLDALMVFQRGVSARPAAQFDAFKIAVGTSSANAWASLVTAVAAHPANARKLAIIGSSTSACTGPSSPDSCYVNRLSAYYNSIGQPITINNLAVGGTDPYQAMPTSYTPPAGRPATNTSKNITAAIASNPSVILVNFPTNSYCTYTVAEIMNCFRIMKQAANNAGIPCYITTTQPREEGCFLNDDVQRKLTEINDSVFLQFGDYAIDFYTTLADPNDSTIANQYNSGDGIHLNNAGHRILFQRVLAKDIFNAIALPVRFTGFSGVAGNKENILTWTTESEEAIGRFELQRSSTGQNFTTIGTVSATNASGAHTYSFNDRTFAGIVNYYRVAEVDLDGRTSYTRIIRIARTQGTGVENAYVANNTVYLSISSAQRQKATIRLLNAMGQQLMQSTQQLEQGTMLIKLPVHAAAGGLYFISISAPDGTTVKKVML